MPKFLDAVKGFWRHLRHHVQAADHRGVSGEAGSGRAALPRPPPAQPVSGRLEKCIGCELCAWACPADAIYVEGPTTPRPNGIRPANATGGCTRSIICAASAAGCASRPARPAR